MAEIPELLLLEDIEALSEAYRREFGQPPINLSTWDPSFQLLDGLEPKPPAMRSDGWIDYSFSYDLDERAELIAKFGFDQKLFGGLATHSGSTAIISVINWLRAIRCKRILIIAPRYFSVPHALNVFDIEYDLLHVRRTPAGYVLPDIKDVTAANCDAVWITHPVYCTSVDFNGSVLNTIRALVHRHKLICVVDECLSEPGRYISASLAESGPVTAIFAPHKAVCINGLKFGFVAFPAEHQRHFDAWSDVWNGCLPASSVLAVRHFLSPDFERYRGDFKSKIANSHALLRSIVGKFPNLSLDSGADGYLVSVFVPRLSHDLGTNLPFLRDATWSSGASFIAGARNELDPASGLSFRVNLSNLDQGAAGALARLCDWLNTREDD